MGNCTSLPLLKGGKYNLQALFNQAIGPDANEEQLAKLISSKVDVNTKIEHEGIGSCYPIHIATKAGNLRAVQMLIKAGADVKLKDGNGKEALHWAAVGSNEEILDDLVKAGADLDAKDNNGITPLKEAIIDKNDAMVEKLIELGADINLDNNNIEDSYPPLITTVKEDNALACLQLLQAPKISPTASVIAAVQTWAHENNHEFVLEKLEQNYPNGEPAEVPRQEADGAEQHVVDSAEEVTADGGAVPEETTEEEATIIEEVAEEAEAQGNEADGEEAEGEPPEGEPKETEPAEEEPKEAEPAEEEPKDAEPTEEAAPEEAAAEGEEIPEG